MKPKKVLTPGSYGKTTPPPRKKVGRPSSVKKLKRARRKLLHRENYSEEDMVEAIRLVKEEEYSIKAAAALINDRKKKEIPRMTLSNRLRRTEPGKMPKMGRPAELRKEVEEALVKCLEICASFNYPMRKKDLQDLVQAYCVEHGIKTRWVEDRPGKHWIRNFRRRWSHRVKVRKPKNIKRSRARVSPEEVRDFFQRMRPNLEGVSRHHIFNYDESPFCDDPGAEEAFCPGGTKYFEQVQNHSKTYYSVMFCCSAAGDMLPPMVVYKSGTGSVYPVWCKGGPDGTVYGASKSGWFDMALFNKWFQEVMYLPYFFPSSTLPYRTCAVSVLGQWSKH
jgi:hypothetical protein